RQCYCSLFFSNAPPTSEIYTLSLHDALPILVFRPHLQQRALGRIHRGFPQRVRVHLAEALVAVDRDPFLAGGDEELDEVVERLRSEEHTSELQSRRDLVCRLLLEKKKKYHKE